MQPLIHQASLYGLTVPIAGSGIVPGQDVTLESTAERNVEVYVDLPSRWPFGLGRPRRICLGYLHPMATELLLPALDIGASLRVRIVEVEPAHARADGVDSVCISVWGDPEDLEPSARHVMSFGRAQTDETGN
jgi:hypothetical protein